MFGGGDISSIAVALLVARMNVLYIYVYVYVCVNNKQLTACLLAATSAAQLWHYMLHIRKYHINVYML